MPFAYYNEFDKSAAEWLRQLIKEGAITDGVVDERSIEDVVPTELAEFDRCHFFAGIAAWDYALTAAGWRDGDGQVWTGSCPCQPFSSAGKGEGFADERHLWPAWFHLIEQCRPRVIFGEQVSSKDTMPWIDLVHADLEGALYTVGAADLCSPSVGAPHIRQRLYFVADATDSRRQREQGERPAESQQKVLREGEQRVESGSRGTASDDLAKPVSVGRRGRSKRSDEREICDSRCPKIQTSGSGNISESRRSGEIQTLGRGPTNGFWRNAEWIYCRDGKYRPVGTVEPGSFEVADVTAADLGYLWDQSSGRYTISPLIEKGRGRVVRLRGYGNAIVPEVAIEWIKSYLDR